jgi:predicted nucleotidyltransferase
MDRYEIIEKLREGLEPLPFIYAMWLEGADATGLLDVYSDLDICVDFEDEYELQAYLAVEKTLREIGEIDYEYICQHENPKLRQRIYHLAGTSEYLMIDFCWQLHSRNRDEGVFIRGSNVEAALVIFDKAGVVRYKDYDPKEFEERNLALLAESKFRYTQHARVIKYVRRGTYPEAYAYYNHYVLEPLVNVLRILYTPAYAYNHMLHISHHIPKSESDRLSYFARIASLEDIEYKTPRAQKWFGELAEKAEALF